MNQALVRTARVGLTIMLAGWILSALALANPEGAPHLSAVTRTIVRYIGFVAVVAGATVGVAATIGGPTVVIVAGAAVNLAYQSGAIDQPALGIVGAGTVLLGALWASRRVRRLQNDPPAPPVT